jgi:hypothetical protein
MRIRSQDDRGHTVNAEFLIGGAASSADRLCFDWKSRGKAGTGKGKSTHYESVHTLGSCRNPAMRFSLVAAGA